MSKKKVHIDEQEWVYFVGKSYVVIEFPYNNSSVTEIPVIKTVPIPDIKGAQWTDLERGRWKKTSDGMVTPSEVKTYIEKTYIPNLRKT